MTSCSRGKCSVVGITGDRTSTAVGRDRWCQWWMDGCGRLFAQSTGANDLVAKTTTTFVTDDVDGAAGASPITFGLQGVAYSMDLSHKNLEQWTKAVAPFSPRTRRGSGFHRALPLRRPLGPTTWRGCASGRPRTRSCFRSAAHPGDDR
jgi:hypothetical protein